MLAMIHHPLGKNQEARLGISTIIKSTTCSLDLECNLRTVAALPSTWVPQPRRKHSTIGDISWFPPSQFGLAQMLVFAGTGDPAFNPLIDFSGHDDIACRAISYLPRSESSSSR